MRIVDGDPNCEMHGLQVLLSVRRWNPPRRYRASLSVAGSSRRGRDSLALNEVPVEIYEGLGQLVGRDSGWVLFDEI